MKLTSNIINRLTTGTRGRFVSATFTKKEGETRSMNFRVPKNPNITKTGFITVVERNGQFRNVNLQTISRLAMDGKIYTS